MGTAIVKRANLAVATSATDVVEHVNNMRIEATVAKLAMDELSDIYGYSVYKTNTTRVSAEFLKESSGKLIELSASEMHEYRQRHQHYLEQMNRLTEAAGIRVLQRVASLPLT